MLSSPPGFGSGMRPTLFLPDGVISGEKEISRRDELDVDEIDHVEVLEALVSMSLYWKYPSIWHCW